MRFLRRLPDLSFINSIFTFISDSYLHFTDKKKLREGRKVSSNVNSLRTPPLVSVYIPTFNRSQLLIERALKSVLSQTYQNLEIIISDDGSTDDTEKRIKDIKDNRIKYLKNSRKGFRYPNKSIYHWFCGPVEAANLALRNVSGEWIARIDDDDNWTKDHIEKLLNFAVENNFEFVSSHLEFREKGKTKTITGFDDPRDPTGIGGTQTWLYRSYLKSIEYNIHCWRKKYFRTNDTDLQYRFWRAGVKIGYLKEVTAFIVPRPGEEYIGSAAYLSNSEFYEKFYN